MRFLVLGLGVLACGGEAATKADGDPMGGAGGASLPAGATAGITSKPSGGGTSSGGAAAHGGATAAGSGGTAPTTGGTPTAGAGGSSSGSGGVATAGTSDSGGSSGAAAGDAGAGGEAGAPPAPDDTGCIERPWSGNQADLTEKLPGLDCSSCSAGSELGYTAPAFCQNITTCGASVDVTTLPDDVFLLLPPGSAQGADCKAQNCEGANGQPADLPGFVAQLFLTLPAGHAVKIETDPDRRVLKRDLALFKCAEASSCVAYGSAAPLVIVVKPGAPRGWARIRVDQGGSCQ